MGTKLTLEDGKRALLEHAREKGEAIRAAYGPDMDYPALLRLLQDKNHVRFPTRLLFDGRRVEPGFFGMVEAEGESPEEGYVLTLRAHFEDRPHEVPALALYHLVSVNYGDFSTSRDAEAFGAAALGMDPEAYYELICRLADRIGDEASSGEEGHGQDAHATS